MVDNYANQLWEKNLMDLAYKAFQPVTLNVSVSAVASPTLKNAYLTCERTTAEHSRSFHIASALLPTSKRKAVRALYAFCRVADDIVDEGEGPRQTRFGQFKRNILSPRPYADDGVALAWADTRYTYRIPLGYTVQLLEGVERDLYQNRYETFEELALYCYGVASTVGLMSMHIIGFESPNAIRYAVKLGVALQLTNVLRDVGEDWRSGRLYLPREELDAFQLSSGDIARQQVDDRWRNFMRYQIKRTRKLYAESQPGIAMLHPEGRFAVSAAAGLYQGILDDIEAHDYDVFSRRAYVRGPAKAAALARAYWQSKKRSSHSL